MTLDTQSRMIGLGQMVFGVVTLVGLAFFAMNIDRHDPLPPELADRCEPLTPAPLRVNEKRRPSTPVTCPEGYMPVYR